MNIEKAIANGQPLFPEPYYTVVVIGCGSIGAMKSSEFDSPFSQNVLTHAHAIHTHPNFKLVGVIDNNRKQVAEAGIKWGCPAFASIGAFKEVHSEADVVVIATPTSTHLKVINKALELKPRLIVGEKPLGNSSKECQRINDLCDSEGVPILVHYIRRFESVHQQLHRRFQETEVLNCRLVYGRGLMHDGCHALDLMSWWFGEFKKGHTNHAIVDGSADRVSYGVIGSWEKCHQVIFTPLDSIHYGVFELDIFDSEGRVILINNGTEILTCGKTSGDDYGSYPSLEKNWESKETSLTDSMLRVYDNAAIFLQGYEDLKCTGRDALNVWKIYDGIR